MFRPLQESSLWLRLTNREQLMSPKCSKQQVLSFAKMLVVWRTNKNYFVLTGVLQNAQPINSERIYAQTRHSSFPGLISVVRVNESRTTDVTRMLEATGAELCQNACGVVNEQKIFCSHQCSPECSMNKLRVYISADTCFVLRRTHQCGSS